MKTPSTRFRKMNGLGNDFAVFDGRRAGIQIDAGTARRIADRQTGVGCDQVIIMEPSARADVLMRILNADGSEVSACGNATRCIAALVGDELGRMDVSIETAAGLLSAIMGDDGMVTVDMGEPRFHWRDIPLAREMETDLVDFAISVPDAGELTGPHAVNVGNPHCIFFRDNIGDIDLAVVGPLIETHELFPERVNVTVAQITSRSSMTIKVWERGAGLTKACGTAACAAAVSAVRAGKTDRKVTVTLPGGDLLIEWRENDNRILMTGPYELEYEGEFSFEASLDGDVRLFA